MQFTKLLLGRLSVVILGLGFTINGYSQGSRFQLISGPFASWSAANADAISKGGHLATFTSLQEWQEFTNLFGATIKSQPNPWWLGATDLQQAGVWGWVTGEPFSFNNWGQGQPSGTGVNGKEDYLSLTASDLRWNDAANVIQFPIGYVLEFDTRV